MFSDEVAFAILFVILKVAAKLVVLVVSEDPKPIPDSVDHFTVIDGIVIEPEHDTSSRHLSFSEFPSVLDLFVVEEYLALSVEDVVSELSLVHLVSFHPEHSQTVSLSVLVVSLEVLTTVVPTLLEHPVFDADQPRAPHIVSIGSFQFALSVEHSSEKPASVDISVVVMECAMSIREVVTCLSFVVISRR